jgi:predicted MFS family arabinose efflux permease
MSWRETLQIMACGVLVFGCAAAYLLERAPVLATGANGQAAGLSLGQTLKTPVFRWLYLCALISAPVMFVPFAHISAAARDAGVPEAQTVGLVGLIGIGSLTGRFGIALVANRLGRIQTLLLMQCLLGLTYFIWAGAQERLMFAAFALCFGLSYGSIVSLLPAICMDLFGGKAVSAIIGTLYTGAALGNLLGPVVAGKIFDLTHSYDLVIYLSLGLSAIAAVSCWLTLKSANQGA